MTFTLREGCEADNAACGILVSRAAMAADYASRISFARAYFAATAPLALPAGFQRIVAVDERGLVGLVQFDPNERYVKYLFTDPRAQGLGVGSALLDAAETAIDAPIRLTTLWINDRGLLWYMRRGYRITGGEMEADWHGGPVVWIELEKPKMLSTSDRSPDHRRRE